MRTSEEIFEIYKQMLLKDGIKWGGTMRYNVIQYLCSFPALDANEMAAAVIREGVEVKFDDSSISQHENAAHQRRVMRLVNA